MNDISPDLSESSTTLTSTLSTGSRAGLPITHLSIQGTRIAIVAYNHNGRAVLPAFLSSVVPVARTAGVELLVVDDASTDASVSWLQSRPDVRLLALPERHGVAGALNKGFEAVRPCDVIRLHTTTLPDDDHWLERLVQAAMALPMAGVLGGRVITVDGRILAEGRHLVTGLGLTSQTYNRCFLEPDSPSLQTSPADNLTIETDSVPGDLALYRRSMLDTVGGLDPVYWPAGLEDDDLCFAARAKNFRVYVLPLVRAVRLTPTPPPEGGNASPLQQLLNMNIHVREAQAEYWKHKWGWDPLLPDLGEVRRLYGHTAVTWAIGKAMRWSAPPNGEHSLPTVDLCMVTWNGAQHLERCLSLLGQTDYPADLLHLYVIDNASTDESPTILEHMSSILPFAAHVTRLAINTGGVVALNWAFSQGTGDLVAKLDDDIMVPPDWLRRLAQIFQRRPYAGVVGPRIVDDTPAGLVQCADYTYYPVPFCHEQEPDTDEAPWLARVTHVRGCCNLYRRDVFARCGMLDIRFSPSQWDDPDHHMALLAAGYEVIYANGVRVAHKCATGNTASGQALAQASINKAKMLVKWGQNSPNVLECALLLSREGRYISPEADEPAPTPLEPDPQTFPRLPTTKLVRRMREQGHSLTVLPEPPLLSTLPGMTKQLWEQALESRSQGNGPLTQGRLRMALACTPQDPHLLQALAEVLEDAGGTVQARVLHCRAVRLYPADKHPTDNGLLPPVRNTRALPHISDVSTPQVRVVFCIPHSHRLDIPLLDVLTVTARALTRQQTHADGIHFDVRVDSSACPLLRTENGLADLVHLWTLDSPHETLAQLKAVRNACPRLPVLLSPLWQDERGPLWADTVVREALRLHLSSGASPETLNTVLEQLPPPETVSVPQDDKLMLRRLALPLAHEVLVGSPEEWNLLPVNKPFSVRNLTTMPPLLPNDHAPCPANPMLFRQASGLNDFVLAVAPFRPVANQIMLLAALRALDLPLVLVGESLDPLYLQACRHLAGKRCLFVKEMSADLLASAFAAARVYALPALGAEGERAALTAACAGTPVVVAAHSPEARTLQHAQTCNPASPKAIREAVLKAWEPEPASPLSARMPMVQVDPAVRLRRIYVRLLQ